MDNFSKLLKSIRNENEINVSAITYIVCFTLNLILCVYFRVINFLLLLTQNLWLSICLKNMLNYLWKMMSFYNNIRYIINFNNLLIKLMSVNMFQLFPQGQTKPWEYGAQKVNKPKNRYANIVACKIYIFFLIYIYVYTKYFTDDHSRVKLEKIQGDEYSDYINANFIDVSTSTLSIFIYLLELIFYSWFELTASVHFLFVF